MALAEGAEAKLAKLGVQEAGHSVSERTAISDLRQRPEFAAAVADRVWRAWWKGRGIPLDYIAQRLTENLNAEPVPFALVAHQEGAFLGTASVISSDLAERPQYSPWVAAVWVEPAFRRRGIGAALVNRAAQDIFALGIDRAYLCASPDRRDFYVRRGWIQIEEQVGENLLTVLIRNA